VLHQWAVVAGALKQFTLKATAKFFPFAVTEALTSICKLLNVGQRYTLIADAHGRLLHMINMSFTFVVVGCLFITSELNPDYTALFLFLIFVYAYYLVCNA
jgi:hypothetical protein